MGGIFDGDLENGLVEEPEGKRMRFEKERRKGSKKEEKETGRNALFQPMLLSRQPRIKQIQEGNRGVNFKLKI